MAIQIQTRLLDGTILSLVDRESLYGYVLTQQVKTVFNVSESTIYPVLRRLKKDQYLVTFDKSYQGRNRRYYQITAAGREELQAIREEWNNFSEKVDQIMGEENE